MEVIFIQQKRLGKFPGFVVGWLKSFDYVVGSSAVSIGFASIFYIFPTFTFYSKHNYNCSCCLAHNTNNSEILKGIKEASGANTGLVVLKVSALIIFIIVGDVIFNIVIIVVPTIFS